MSADKSLSIGISGHQDLGSQDNQQWIKTQLRREIKSIYVADAYSSLAIGADQLFAEICVDLGINLKAVIPSQQYETTFSARDEKKYTALLKKCQNVQILDYPNPSEGAFLAAGKQLVDRCKLLFVVWNQRPSAGLGGTADIFTYARKLSKSIILINPENHNIDYF